MTELSRTRPRILVIDDDDDFCVAMRTLLEARGYAITIAADGRDGLRAVAEGRPDLVILDVMMEDDWAGYGVTYALKYRDGAAAAHPPIVMVSSVPVDPAVRFGRAGEAPMVTADEYLTKPLDFARLLEVVARFVGPGVQPPSPAPSRH